jgi:hypothetical protein
VWIPRFCFNIYLFFTPFLINEQSLIQFEYIFSASIDYLYVSDLFWFLFERPFHNTADMWFYLIQKNIEREKKRGIIGDKNMEFLSHIC